MARSQTLKLNASQEECLYLARLVAMNTLFEAARVGLSTENFATQQALLVERSLSAVLDKKAKKG